MFERFVKEKCIYVPYVRKDKIALNYDVYKRLEDNLNSKGVITEIAPNPFYNLERDRAKAKSLTAITENNLPFANALIYSNNSPITLDIFENVRVHSMDPFFGQDIDLNYIGLKLNYFSSADKKDLEFIYDCLEKTRFKKT